MGGGAFFSHYFYPYYLTYKAKKIGYRPKVILAGRKINDSMGMMVSKFAYRSILSTKKKSKKNVLILGATFKENVSDVRNSQTYKIYNYLVI